MNDVNRLSAALAADPGNVSLRLVYADALEEASDTSEAIHQRQLAEVITRWPTLA